MLSKILRSPNVSMMATRTTRLFSTAIEGPLAGLKDKLKGQTVFVRVDFNVPLNKETGAINDDTRIMAALPTINFLQENGARTVLCSHLGRPKGEAKPEMSLKPVADRLGELVSNPVSFVNESIGSNVHNAVQALNDGEVLLLENVRFHKGEEKNDPEFCAQLAQSTNASIYVNDAFGTAHRAHGSTAGVASYSDIKVPGFLMQKELKYLAGAVDAPTRPLTAIIGGAKTSTKLPVLKSLMEKVDNLIIGGGMIFTFYKAQGKNIGKSLVEEDQVDTAHEVLRLAEEHGVGVYLPTDVVVADACEEGVTSSVVSVDAIPDGQMGLDIGPDSVKDISAKLQDSKTIVWNGPMGVFEIDQFATGTNEVAKAIAGVSTTGAISIVGGGDSVSAAKKSGLADQFSHISTGGGASLEMLEGKVLPGVAILQKE